jgi:hypothetical protein
MKTYRTNNLEVNFVTKEVADSAGKLAMDKLWMLPVDAVVETWYGADGETLARRWASGWLETRGWRAGSGTSTITLPFPYRSVQEQMIILTCSVGGYSYYSNQTPTSFSINTSGSPTGVVWYIIGMGDA